MLNKRADGFEIKQIFYPRASTKPKFKNEGILVYNNQKKCKKESAKCK